MPYKGLKGAASIPANDIVSPIRHVRKHHSLALQTPFANTDIYKSSFFPKTIRDRNLIIAAEGAEDSINLVYSDALRSCYGIVYVILFYSVLK